MTTTIAKTSRHYGFELTAHESVPEYYPPTESHEDFAHIYVEDDGDTPLFWLVDTLYGETNTPVLVDPDVIFQLYNDLDIPLGVPTALCEVYMNMI